MDKIENNSNHFISPERATELAPRVAEAASALDEFVGDESAQADELLSPGDESDLFWERDRFRERLARGLAGSLPNELPPPESNGAEFELPDEETQLLELTVIFQEILDNEKDHERYDLALDSLRKALDMLIASGAITHATELVKRLKGLPFRTEHPQRLAKVKALLNWASSPGVVERLGRHMSRGDDEAAQAGGYLKQLDARALPGMVLLLENLTSRGARLTVEESIAVQCGKNGALLLPHLAHETWHVVASLTRSLGLIADPASIKALGSLLKNKELNIRREAISALSKIEYAKATNYIASAMTDEDSGIRVQAAKIIVEHTPAMAYGKLVEIVSDKKFNERQFGEKKSFYQLIGKSGGKRSVEFLSERFKKGGLFSVSTREEERACAAYGLAAAGGAEAKRLLESEVGSANKLLKVACTEGLRQMKGKI